MNNDRLLRIGAVAAVAAAVAQFVASALEPDWGGVPGKAIRVVAGNGFWTGDRLLDLIGLVLTVGALTVVGRTFRDGPGGEWARAGYSFLVLMGALGAAAIVAGANMKELADTWTSAAPGAREPYLASFDAAQNTTEDLFFAAFLALGVYLAALAAAIVAGRVYARWLGWASAVSAALVLTGDLLDLVSDTAFVAVLAGYVLYLVVLIGLGVSLWRQADRLSPEPDPARQARPLPRRGVREAES